MKLHLYPEEFQDLITLASEYKGIPENAVRRDYYIVKMMQNLEKSEYADMCVFKGGTSLSKCYPGAIDRFSEDIDITFIPDDSLSKKQYDKALKNVEHVISEEFHLEKIPEERNDRNKSAFVWPCEEDKESTKIKLEIGSSVRPDPYYVMSMRTYIQEYLNANDREDAINEYELCDVTANTLAVERTFLDKVMSVKRHAICGSLAQKVRHIYDVAMLFKMPEIQSFLQNTDELKKLLQETKETDSFYLQKRNLPAAYDPTGLYDFPEWKKYFDAPIKSRYESLHNDLLYTDQKQDFERAVRTFERINSIFTSIGE